MKRPTLTTAALSTVLACVLAATDAQAQWLAAPTPGIPRLADGKADLNAPAPRAVDGKPDLSGVWRRAASEPDRNRYLASDLKEIPLQPAARQLYDRRIAADGAGRPAERCLPHGLPTEMMFREAPFRIVQTPTLTLILLEYLNHFRQVPTNGRTLAPDPQPTWFGYSTGKWEADEFVVETTGFNDDTWLDNRGLPHSDVMRLVERFTRLTVGRMTLTLTVDDPKTYTRPWSVVVAMELVPDADLLEFVCENNKYNPPK